MQQSMFFRLVDQDNVLLCETPIVPFSHVADPFFEFTNFYENAPFKEDGVVFKSVEHYFHFHQFKILGKDDWAFGVLAQRTSIDALKYSETYSMSIAENEIWIGRMLEVMEKALRLKFAFHKDLQRLLELTGDAVLIEDDVNKIDKSFWGWGSEGVGENNLGLLLMMLRQEMRASGLIGRHYDFLQHTSASNHEILGYWKNAKVQYLKVRQAREKVLSIDRNTVVTQLPLKLYGSPLTKNEIPNFEWCEKYGEIYKKEQQGRISLIAARQAKWVLLNTATVQQTVSSSTNMIESLENFNRVQKVSPEQRDIMRIYLGSIADVSTVSGDSKYSYNNCLYVFKMNSTNLDYCFQNKVVFKFEDAAHLPQKVYYDPEMWECSDDIKKFFDIKSYETDIDSKNYVRLANYVVVAGTEFIFSDTHTYFNNHSQRLIPLVVARATGVNMQSKPNIDSFTLKSDGKIILDEKKIKAVYSKAIHLLFSAFYDLGVTQPIISPFTEFGALGNELCSSELPAAHSRVIAEVFAELLTENDYKFETVFFSAPVENIESTYYYDLNHALNAIVSPSVKVINNTPMNLFFALHEMGLKNLGLSVASDYCPEPVSSLYDHANQGYEQLLSSIATSFVKSPSLFPARYKCDDTYVAVGNLPKEYIYNPSLNLIKSPTFLFSNPSIFAYNSYIASQYSDPDIADGKLVNVNPHEHFNNKPLQKQMAINLSQFDWRNIKAAEHITKNAARESLKKPVCMERPTKISIQSADLLETAYTLSSRIRSKRVAVIISANFKTVGGLAFDGESLSEEAHWCRSTSLACSLLKMAYLKEGALVCSKNDNETLLMGYKKNSLGASDVLYSREVKFTALLDEANEYHSLPLEMQSSIDVISSATLCLKNAVRYTYSTLFSGSSSSDSTNCLVDHRDNVYFPNQANTLKLHSNIIRTQFNSALLNDVEILVLDAHGCGAERNDPRYMASLYKKIIEQEYPGRFAQIIFAISDPKNYSIFKSTFGNTLTRSNTHFFVSSKYDDLDMMKGQETSAREVFSPVTKVHDVLTKIQPSLVATAYFPMELCNLAFYLADPLAYLRAACEYFVSADPQYRHPLRLTFKCNNECLTIQNRKKNGDLSSFHQWLQHLRICKPESSANGEVLETIRVPLRNLKDLYKTLGQTDVIAYQSVEKLLISELINPYLFLESSTTTLERRGVGARLNNYG